jgi:hypothetical protein
MSHSSVFKAVYKEQIKSVRRVGVAATDLPAAAFNIFRIWNCPVFVQFMFGHVTTIIAGAATPLIQFTPTTGGAITPLCTAALSIDTDAVGTVYTWDGAVATALAPTAAIGLADTTETLWAGNYVLLVPGIISITNAGALATGVIDWYISYQPCAPEAYVAAV